ncbi:MAG TPA: flagellar protein FlaG [Bryobacteraceae bacterium]|nr:flagellar protein FlaG [Bryobacteraceae bacterium]
MSETPIERAAENRDVIQAVKALNGTEMFGQENELQFQIDRQTQRMVIRIVNRKTKEVVSQIPAEYVVRLAEELRRQQAQIAGKSL